MDEELERAKTVCQEIAADMERDASEFDGKPFNGRTVAEYFGNHGAAIAALAGIIGAAHRVWGGRRTMTEEADIKIPLEDVVAIVLVAIAIVLVTAAAGCTVGLSLERDAHKYYTQPKAQDGR